jgi:hypothetical protein
MPANIRQERSTVPSDLRQMNIEYVVRNLHEAAEQLEQAIADAGNDDLGPLMVRIAFTYRKLNLAWNSRFLTAEELLSQTDEQFESRCQFPDDLSGLI